jgi:3-oxoacyl-[acyl-carrier-protein] synthase-3
MRLVDADISIAAAALRLPRHRDTATVLRDAYRPALAAAGLHGRAVLNLGRRTGHLGAGDAAANLADLTARGKPAPGEIVRLLSAGAGFTWSCAVVSPAV